MAVERASRESKQYSKKNQGASTPTHIWQLGQFSRDHLEQAVSSSATTKGSIAVAQAPRCLSDLQPALGKTVSVLTFVEDNLCVA